MQRVLTFLSDFGLNTPYPAAMKAVASSITRAHLLDLSHEIAPYNVLEGAFVLWSAAPYFPEGTVHCAVVDPGVGTERRKIILISGRQIFVGPDNGLLAPVAQVLGTPQAYEIVNSRYFLNRISATFHGRDVFAPVAAHLANGVPPEEIGQPLSRWVVPELDFQGGQFFEDERVFRGHVIYIDRFGNAITNIRSELFLIYAHDHRSLTLKTCQQERPLLVRESYGFGDRGELCAIPGSHDLIEIAVREGSAQKALDLRVGDPIALWLP